MLPRMARWIYKSQSTGICVSPFFSAPTINPHKATDNDFYRSIEDIFQCLSFSILLFLHTPKLLTLRHSILPTTRRQPALNFIIFIYLRRYNVVFMFLTYFLPIGAMTFTYATVGVELWGSQSIGECTQRQLDNIKSKRKVGNKYNHNCSV